MAEDERTLDAELSHLVTLVEAARREGAMPGWAQPSAAWLRSR